MTVNENKMLSGSQQQKTFRNWAIVLCILAFFLQYFTISLGGDIYNVLCLQFPDYTKGQISSMMTIGGAIAWLFAPLGWGDWQRRFRSGRCRNRRGRRRRTGRRWRTRSTSRCSFRA